jgi:hypothetical protein
VLDNVLAIFSPSVPRLELNEAEKREEITKRAVIDRCSSREIE